MLTTGWGVQALNPGLHLYGVSVWRQSTTYKLFRTGEPGSDYSR